MRWSSVLFPTPDAPDPETAAQVLSQLVAPALEAGGAEAGEVMARAARAARTAAAR